MDFGLAMRRARKGMGLNQTQVAERSGVNIGFVVDLEAGKPTCQLDKALTVAVVVGFRFPDVPFDPDAPVVGQPVADEDDIDLSHVPRF